VTFTHPALGETAANAIERSTFRPAAIGAWRETTGAPIRAVRGDQTAIGMTG
jgi:hypothetical protein